MASVYDVARISPTGWPVKLTQLEMKYSEQVHNDDRTDRNPKQPKQNVTTHGSTPWFEMVWTSGCTPLEWTEFSRNVVAAMMTTSLDGDNFCGFVSEMS